MSDPTTYRQQQSLHECILGVNPFMFGRSMAPPPWNQEQWYTLLALVEWAVNTSDAVVEDDPLKDWLDAYRLWLDSTRRKEDGFPPSV
jgi:hypothetical protein